MKNGHDIIKIKNKTVTIRGESPRSGVSSAIFDMRDDGEVISVSEAVNFVKRQGSEVLTIIGQPLRQLHALATLSSNELFSNVRVIIESSGRVEPTGIGRMDIVPIVKNTTLVIKPVLNALDRGKYDWMHNYRFDDLYIKFEWQGNEHVTKALIAAFFDVSRLNMLKLVDNWRILIMPSDINNINECRDVWAFSLRHRLRYSGREFVRLFDRSSFDDK